MSASLIIQTGKLKGKKLNLPNSEVIVGRDEGCQIKLATDEISRKHCVFRSTTEGLWLRDLGSSNGTLVNDVPISEEVELDHGDTIQIGPMLFQVAGLEKKPNSENVSDDDIADWLGGPEESNSGSTTIIRKDSPAYAAIQAANEESVRLKRASKFSSVAEEGRDIIRRHFEQLEQNKSDLHS